MLKIDSTEKPGGWMITLCGKLAGEWTDEARRTWQEVPGPVRWVDLSQVRSMDEAGRALVADWHRANIKLLVGNLHVQQVVEQITGVAHPIQQGGWMVRTAIMSLVLLGLSGWNSAQAQEVARPTAVSQDQKSGAEATGPLKLTLEGAVKMALEQNPQVQLAVLQRATATQDSRLARAALLPKADGIVNQAARRGNIETNLGQGIPGIAQHIGPFAISEYGFSFNATVFNLSLWNRLRASREQINAAISNEFSVREQIVALVVGQYLAATRADATVAAAHSRMELAAALYRQARTLQEAGVGTGLDTLRANQKLQVERQREIVAQTQLETTLFGLARLLNYDPKREVALADAFNYYDQSMVAPEEANLEAAWSQRPELKVIDARRRAAALQVRAAKDERLPTVSATGTFSEQGTRFTNAIPTYDYRASLRIPILTGGRTGAEIAKSQIEIKNLERQREEVVDQIAADVKTARMQVVSALKEVEVANLGVTLARQEVEQAKDRFQAGVANNIEVVSAQDALAQANDDQIAALYRLSQSRADLARATGRMEATYHK